MCLEKNSLEIAGFACQFLDTCVQVRAMDMKCAEQENGQLASLRDGLDELWNGT